MTLANFVYVLDQRLAIPQSIPCTIILGDTDSLHGISHCSIGLSYETIQQTLIIIMAFYKQNQLHEEQFFEIHIRWYLQYNANLRCTGYLRELNQLQTL